MKNIALIGFGKMGKMIQDLSPKYDCRIVSIIDPHHPEAHNDITLASIANADVCIEFSHPDCVLANIRKAAELGINLVVGTTGWNQHFAEVKALVDSTGIGLMYGSNFSIGMNLFLRIVENAAKEFNRFEDYDLYGFELHHRQKADSPSGTAISIADALLNNCDRKAQVNYNRLERKINSDELHFASIRAGFIPGTHTVGFDSEADTIELTHRVRNRSCFAVGALQAAKWIADKKGIFSFKDMVEELVC